MKKIIITLLALGTLAACNSGGNSTTSFSISSISPTSGSKVVITPNTQTFTATFNSNVNSSTITNQTITLTNSLTAFPVSLACSVTAQAANVVVCTTTSIPSTGQSYTLTFKSGIQSSSGVALSQVSYNYSS